MKGWWRKLFSWLLPDDPIAKCGYGPLELKESWMLEQCQKHDKNFEQAKTSGQRLSEADWDLFYGWVMEAAKAPGPIERCNRAEKICKYWPVARKAGKFLWDG